MRTSLFSLAVLVALPVAAQQGTAPSPATPRSTPTTPRGPGSVNNPAFVSPPAAAGRTFAPPSAIPASGAVDPATGTPLSNGSTRAAGATVFPPPGTQVVSPGVAVGGTAGIPGTSYGVVLTPNGPIMIPTTTAPAQNQLDSSTANSTLGAATAGSTLGSTLGAASGLGNSLGVNSGLGSATGGPGLGGSPATIPTAGVGAAAGTSSGFGNSAAAGGASGALIGGTAPNLAGAFDTTGNLAGVGTNIVSGTANPLAATNVGGTFPTVREATPGSLSGPATPTLIVPNTALGTAGAGTVGGVATGIQPIQVPAPVYLPPPVVEEFIPQQQFDEIHPIVPPVNTGPRITPRSATRMIRQLPPPVTPPPPSPR
ncbi:MAG: hypothetical protein ACO1QB_14595 [Verrucomicrobiales bacterium]